MACWYGYQQLPSFLESDMIRKAVLKAGTWIIGVVVLYTVAIGAIQGMHEFIVYIDGSSR